MIWRWLTVSGTISNKGLNLYTSLHQSSERLKCTWVKETTEHVGVAFTIVVQFKCIVSLLSSHYAG